VHGDGDGFIADAPDSQSLAEEGGDERGDDFRVLILAPRGRNAQLTENILEKAGIATFVCRDALQLCEEIIEPAGAVVVCEEALNRAHLECLVGTLEQQPPWSEIPLLVLTGAGKTTRGSFQVAQALGPRGNATLIERPIRIITLVSAARAALRARKRQYEVRDLLDREHAARAQAEAASRAKDQFLAALSHELRTPLNPVLMTVTAMAGDPELPARFREDVEVIKRNVELESSLIDDLLDLTRITRGKLELHHEAVDLHALLNQALNTCCDGDAKRKRLVMRVEPGAASHHVWADPARLSQVFWNLLKNAVKFTPTEGRITVTTENETDSATGMSWVLTRVTDTGIGIEPDAAARIFDAFEQENRGITRRFGGLGLGLAISKALVERHGGTIAVESRGKGAGATFTVRLATAPEPSRDGESTPSADGRGAVGGSKRILLVEDHETTANVMSRLLSAMSYSVVTARDLASARKLAESEAFDLLVSDIGLPDGTGLDLLRHLRSTCRDVHIPALAVSGFGMEEDLRLSREAGFTEHLVKPVDLNKLRAAIERAIGEGKAR
jgi:signal transduction histidine kinase/CheY-like chemotaxis protein